MLTKAKAQKAETEQKIDDQICFSPKIIAKARTRKRHRRHSPQKNAAILGQKL